MLIFQITMVGTHSPHWRMRIVKTKVLFAVDLQEHLIQKVSIAKSRVPSHSESGYNVKCPVVADFSRLSSGVKTAALLPKAD